MFLSVSHPVLAVFDWPHRNMASCMYLNIMLCSVFCIIFPSIHIPDLHTCNFMLIMSPVLLTKHIRYSSSKVNSLSDLFTISWWSLDWRFGCEWILLCNFALIFKNFPTSHYHIKTKRKNCCYCWFGGTVICLTRLCEYTEDLKFTD